MFLWNSSYMTLTCCSEGKTDDRLPRRGVGDPSSKSWLFGSMLSPVTSTGQFSLGYHTVVFVSCEVQTGREHHHDFSKIF